MPIETRNADPDAPFTLASLVGDAGVGANGEKLVDTLKHHYPPDLRAAMLKRINRRLTDGLSQDQIGSAAKVAGAPADSDLNVKVHGGQSRDSDAVVTYAFHDDEGRLWKGTFPYSELGKSSPDGHVSQRESLAGAPAAEDYAKAQAKARKAAGSADTDALHERIAELEAQVDAQGDDPEPAEYEGKNAREIAASLGDASRETAARLLSFERDHENRTTVVTAAEKRLEAISVEEAAAVKAQADQAAENDALKARIAELEAAQAPPQQSLES
jgi:BMFP domain-containing protein YqiC